jgi:predicted ABC-type ATPase
MKPKMIVISGPSGSGKTRHFPARGFGVASFNVDDRCAELNGGSYRDTPAELRAQAQREWFIADCTAQRKSFAVETTRRTAIAIAQAERSRTAGRRIARRGLLGGHSAPAARVLDIHPRSLANLARAITAFAELALYDNSVEAQPPRLVRVYRDQRIVYDEPPLPAWLATALGQS